MEPYSALSALELVNLELVNNGYQACGYRNARDRLVIARIDASPTFFLERVVFPFELLTFLAPPECELEIWTHGLGGPELLERLACRDLVLDSGTALTPVGENLTPPCENAERRWPRYAC